MSSLASLCIDIAHVLFIIVNMTLAFSHHPMTLMLSIMINLSLLTHWLTNNDTCALTVVEAIVRGAPSDQTFMHRLVSPVYKFNHETVYYATYIGTILLLMTATIRLARLYKKTNKDALAFLFEL